MPNMEIDFDVFKALTALRKDEATTYNDVIRGLLKLPEIPRVPSRSTGPSDDDWHTKGVRIPAGSEFRKVFNTGKVVKGRVERGALYVNGERFDSPSHAGAKVAGYFVNGWTFWEVRTPASSEWRKMDALR